MYAFVREGARNNILTKAKLAITPQLMDTGAKRLRTQTKRFGASYAVGIGEQPVRSKVISYSGLFNITAASPTDEFIVLIPPVRILQFGQGLLVGRALYGKRTALEP